MSLVVTDSSKGAIRRLALSRVISIGGSEAAYIALFYLVYQRTGSTAWVSLAFLVTFGTLGVMTPIAGSLGDRFDRRRVMVVSELIGAACFLGLSGAHSPELLLILAFFSAAIESPFVSASNAAVAALVEPELLTWANGTVTLGTNMGYLIGPAAGGALLAAFGPRWVFAINAATFVVSAALVAGIRGRFSSATEDEREANRGLRAGITFLFRDRVLRTITLAFVVFLVTIGSVLVAELPLARSFDAGPLGYGLLSGAFSVGALFGALLARRLDERLESRALVVGSTITAAAVAAVAGIPWFAAIMGALAIGGLSDGVVDVAILGVLQRRTPDAVRSRAIGAFEGLVMLAFAGSFTFAGFIVGALGPRASYAFAGGLALLTPVILARGLRDRAGHRAAGDAIPGAARDA